jgi:hypothetical protein
MSRGPGHNRSRTPQRKDLQFLIPVSPESEAKALLPLLKSGGETSASLRALIAVSAREEIELRRIEEKMTADRAIQYRKDIAREFERLTAKHIRSEVRRCP